MDWINFVGRDFRLLPIKSTSVIRAGGFAIAASDAPVVVDYHNPIFFLPSRFDRTDRNTGRVVALLALHRHVEFVVLGNRVIIGGIPTLDIDRTFLHFEHADVRLIRVAVVIVFFIACLHALAVAVANTEVNGVAELNSRNRAMV